MQPVEDIWTCNRCGWTYPNHHPSAKHRRNHKKVCGKVPGHIIEDRHHGHDNGGSSDEASSGDENSHHRVAEVSSVAPSVTPALAVESQLRSFDPSSLVQKPEPEAPASNAVEESTASVEVPKQDTPKAVVGSAVPHPEEDIWICRACGWTYPNAHPSAKHRRNHKKNCLGKAGPKVHAGGSSEDDSDRELHAPKETVNVATSAPTVAEPQTDAVESVTTPIITTTREFSLESVAPKEAVPEASQDASKEVDSTPVVPTSTTSRAVVVEVPTAPVPLDVPVLAPKADSAIPHPDGDIWICKGCGWTYPNHHPSAKHRRNHKKNCPGKVAAVAPAPGGSSDDDSGEEHRHQTPVQAAKPEVVNVISEAQQNGTAFRNFILDSAKELSVQEMKIQTHENGNGHLQVLEVVEVQAPAENQTSATSVILKEVLKDVSPLDVLPAVESKGTLKSVPAVALKESVKEDLLHGYPPVVPADFTSEKLSVGKSPASSKAGSVFTHPDDDIWICKDCGWTYPNHHPSAKHRRNHKKNCPGKVAVAAPAPGGSSDEDSGDENHSHQTPVQALNPEVVNVTNDVAPSVSVSRELNLESLARNPQTAGVEAEPKLPQKPAVRPPVDDASRSQARAEPITTPKEATKEDNPINRAVVPKMENVAISQESVTRKTRVVSIPAVASTQEFKVAKPTITSTDSKSATSHPVGDIWKCPHCDWTYPNAHPSAKHRRNHKKHCAGEAPAKGGSSDDDSDHETHKPVAGTPPTEAMASVSRDFQLLTVEAKEDASNTAPPAPKVEESKIEATPAQPPAPKVEESKIEEAPPAPPAQPQKLEVAAVSTPPKVDGIAVPHPEDPNDIWICKACGWTYPNAHPSAKHRRNHKKHCAGKVAAVGHAPGGSSDDDSDDGSSHKGQISAATSKPVVEPPVVKERAMPDLGVQQPKTTAKAEVPKVEITEKAPLAQLVSDEQSREQEAKSKEEVKPSVETADPQAAHDPNDTWVCKQCGWTYPNRHPSAKHRRNHKKVCKKTNSTRGGSSSDASSDDEHLGHFGKKKCFPCL